MSNPPVQMILRAVACLALACGALLAPAAAHAASTLEEPVITNGELIVDKTATIAVSGFSDPADSDRRLVIDINPMGLGCAATEELNRELRVATTSAKYVEKGQFTGAVLQWMPSEPGGYLMCIWLHDTFPNATFAGRQKPIVVRQPLTLLALALPAGRFRSGTIVPLQVSAASEVAREYSVEVNAAGIPCGPNQGANPEVTTWIYEREVLGTPLPFVVNVSMPADGDYHLCGYVGKSSADTAPTTLIDVAPFQVGPPPRCRLGKSPKSTKKTVKVMCTGTNGPVQVIGQRGGRTYAVTVTLTAGVGAVKGTAIGLKKKKRVTVKVVLAGVTLGSRVLRVK